MSTEHTDKSKDRSSGGSGSSSYNRASKESGNSSDDGHSSQNMSSNEENSHQRSINDFKNTEGLKVAKEYVKPDIHSVRMIVENFVPPV